MLPLRIAFTAANAERARARGGGDHQRKHTISLAPGTLGSLVVPRSVTFLEGRRLWEKRIHEMPQ